MGNRKVMFWVPWRTKDRNFGNTPGECPTWGVLVRELGRPGQGWVGSLCQRPGEATGHEGY